jgi:hypothetical protein
MAGILFEFFEDELNHRVKERRLFALTRKAIIAIGPFKVPFVASVCVYSPLHGPALCKNYPFDAFVAMKE